MQQTKVFIIDGAELSIQAIANLVRQPEYRVEVNVDNIEKIKASREFLEQESGSRIIYGVNTGFGPMASHIINPVEVLQLQKNLIRSHAVGMGQPIDSEYVISAMIIRLNMLIKGFSGVTIDLVKRLEAYINHRIIPIVPEHGAVGTSGDLVQLSHIALAIMGEGEVIYKGKRVHVADALKDVGMDSSYELKSKEGLALINGTAMMTGIGALVCADAYQLLSMAVLFGALSMELIQSYNDGISPRLHQLRPHHGQGIIAQVLSDILSTSHQLRNRQSLKYSRPETKVEKILDSVQEVYSFRCIPQILGPIYDAHRKACDDVEVEMNSVTDNPVIDWQNKQFIHGGNFHGDYIAFTMDQLKIVLAKLTLLSERRINFFLNDNVNKAFPPFLNLYQPGLSLGLQGLQFVATSTAAQNQSFSFPHYIHTIPTNKDNQDIVSMGTDAALIAAKVVENAYVVLAIELITLSQAVDVLSIEEKISYPTAKLFQLFRKVFPKINEDRVIVNELSMVVDFVKTYNLVAHIEGKMFQ